MKASDITNEDEFISHMTKWNEHEYSSGSIDLCGYVTCGKLSKTRDCKDCLGNYNINKLKEITPDINKGNLKENLSIARVLGI